MARLHAAAGASLAQDIQRMDGANLYVPQIRASGTISASSTRATVTATASATPHTVGPWSQAIAATTETIESLELWLSASTNSSGNTTPTLLNIGLGGSGSEVAVVSGIQVGWMASGTSRFLIPIHIPTGSRVSVQCQSAVVSKTVSLVVTPRGPVYSKASPTSLVTMGGASILTTSAGVSLPAVGTANTKTAYTTIQATTTQPFGALVVCPGLQANTNSQTANSLLDIAAGAAASETVIIGDIPFSTTTSESLLPQTQMLFPCNIPAGQRISARWASSSNSAANLMDVILLGVPRQ